MTKQLAAAAGQFKVYTNGSYEGPAGYMADHDQEGILRSVRTLSAAAPAGTTVYQLIAVALQTDYAGWLGMRELGGLRGSVAS